MLEDKSAERATLAGVVQYGSNVWLDVSDLLNDDCFADHINQCVYSCLQHIYHKNGEAVIDLASILSAAADLGLQAELAGETKYIKALFNYHVEEENVRTFTRKLRRLSEYKHLLGSVNEAANKIKLFTGEEPVSEATAIAEKPIFDFTNKLMTGNQTVEQIGVGIDEYYESLRDKENLQGVSIGEPIWEKAVGGLRVGVHVIGARNKTGKSYKALNAACYASAFEKVPVLYLDTELHRSQGQWDRFIARFADGVTVDEIKFGLFFDDPDKEKKVLKSTKIIKKLPLDYINITGKSIGEVISIIRRWLVQKVGYNEKGKINKCLVVYDYLKPPITAEDLKNIQEYQEIGLRLQALHDFTALYGFPILTYVQLNREKEIGASDRIGWYCSSYSVMHRKTPEEIATDGPQNGNLKVITELMRFGEGLAPGNYINYYFDGKTSKIKELKTRDQVEAEKKQNDSADGDNQ